MKRLLSAASLLLILASANVMAEQSGNFMATQTNHSGMIIPPSDNRGDNSHTMGDKSELLGTPYYHESTN
ncbi:multiple antibiotic resistance regulatory protein MarB [Buttiauxella gaviniae]|uniref:Multiple antibiotic resistance regulatory protein MarB n=1 Tax=Buttiauxella gaviniae TaxID=82990 RepID=A0ABV3NZS0_9ENTR